MIYEHFINRYREEPVLYVADWDRDIAPGAVYGPVIRDIYLVECCASGYGSVVINGVEYPICPGDCYVLFPGDTVMHKADLKEPRRGAWCAVDGLMLGQVFSRLGISSTAPFAPKAAFKEIYQHVDALVRMQSETDAGADFRRAGLIYSMLGAFMRYSASASDKHRWIEKAVGIMEARYHESLSVSLVADEVGLERSYFSTLFKEQVGVSPHAYLVSLRIRKACALLSRKDLPVGQIASSVGLDSRNFARLFKKETGKTPKEYRNGNS